MLFKVVPPPHVKLIYISLQDETRKKAASTYLVENSDIPPPRYQKDGTLPVHYPNNIVNSGKLFLFSTFLRSLKVLRVLDILPHTVEKLIYTPITLHTYTNANII